MAVRRNPSEDDWELKALRRLREGSDPLEVYNLLRGEAPHLYKPKNKPTSKAKSAAGTPGRIEEMRDRLATGNHIFHPDDEPVDLRLVINSNAEQGINPRNGENTSWMNEEVGDERRYRDEQEAETVEEATHELSEQMDRIAQSFIGASLAKCGRENPWPDAEQWAPFSMTYEQIILAMTRKEKKCPNSSKSDSTRSTSKTASNPESKPTKTGQTTTPKKSKQVRLFRP